MIRSENPVLIFVALVLLLVGVVVYPWVRTPHFRLTASKAIASFVVIGVCLYVRAIWPALVFLWPLSLIWFPEYWGSYTGFLRGPYINQKSPPALVAAMGWFFLIIFPLFLVWILGG